MDVAYRYDDAHGLLAAADVLRVADAHPDADFYLCGPTPFMGTVETALRARGVGDDRVYLERFAQAPAATGDDAQVADGADIPDLVQIRLKGKTYEVPYAKGSSLLKTALDAGLDAPFSCEEGFCGCCVAQLLEGEVDMASSDALTDAEKKKRFVLTCQSRPKTKRCAFEFFDY
ncbi:2Fe-2S iron-sulfur cluster binding domain-containing protein [bacterium]|nr:MAG: 2Fe-2S iron-sulfur cluster binding domain-containing protein [bacterium]